ncbi:MAG TPA: hypothetical protein VGR30_09765 [Candidatus Binatia bacterium]|jgi:hypothetical protein|nr:hypothetical protein [Candidatus Binatia bacterium]
MAGLIDQAKLNVKGWVEKHRHVVLYEEESSTLLDVFSGKKIELPWRDVKRFEDKVHPETRETYLVLLLEDGRQIALVDPGGVAFEPATINTGPLHDLPPVACLKDFQTLKQRVDHYLYAHEDEPPPKECLDLMMVCIAILDGARAVGFDVGDLEEDLDKSLRELERRKSK